MLDILCVGDCKIDIFLKIPEDNPHFGLDEEKNKLFLSYGEKIYIDKYVLGIGGNATNTSVGMARLGLSVGLCAEIGRDELAKKILEELKKEDVNTDFLSQTDKETSISIGLNYKDDRTLLTEHVQREHLFNFASLQTKFIYLTSLGNVWETTYQQVLEFKKTTEVKLAFNPGTIQLAKKGKVFMNILENTDYLFVNKQEAEELLYGQELELTTNNESQIKKLLYGIKSLGAKNVVITDGDNGSFAQDENNKFYHLEIVRVEVVEKTGAGDAYTAGFLAAVLNSQPIKEAMRWGAFDAASVIQKIGAEEGLLTKTELEDKLKSTENN
ncbi:MAG TPA: carbohydrate kinase family protein [Patescibacteria group bacterium]|jgi:sugar/nucleoside kinase (ribokinase family)|nr:carbohydrate kinase family protein [Patescibacteria group bacterium]